MEGSGTLLVFPDKLTLVKVPAPSRTTLRPPVIEYGDGSDTWELPRVLVNPAELPGVGLTGPISPVFVSCWPVL